MINLPWGAVRRVRRNPDHQRKGKKVNTHALLPEEPPQHLELRQITEPEPHNLLVFDGWLLGHGADHDLNPRAAIDTWHIVDIYLTTSRTIVMAHYQIVGAVDGAYERGQPLDWTQYASLREAADDIDLIYDGQARADALTMTAVRWNALGFAEAT